MSGIGANLVSHWAADLTDLEDQIEALQSAKRDFYAKVREEHGKSTAASLKIAMKLSRLDEDKRQERADIDAEAERMLAIIDVRAPRATRVANAMPNTATTRVAADAGEVDPETVTASPAGESHAKASTGNAVSPSASAETGAEDRKHPKRDGSGEVSRPSRAGGSPARTPEGAFAGLSGGKVMRAADQRAEAPAAQVGQPTPSGGNHVASAPGPIAREGFGNEVLPSIPPETVAQTGAGFGGPFSQGEPPAGGGAVATPAPTLAERAKPNKFTHADPPHADCLDPDQCGGFSNLGLCEHCKSVVRARELGLPVSEPMWGQA